MVKPSDVCAWLLIPLFVSCFYTSDKRGPAIVLTCTVIHFMVSIFRKPDSLGTSFRKFNELMFATTAGLSISVLAGGPQEMATGATVLAILADLSCWGEGEKSSKGGKSTMDGDVLIAEDGRPVLLSNNLTNFPQIL